MYSNTLTCYHCEKPLPSAEAVIIDVDDLDANEWEIDEEIEQINLCEDCYFELEHQTARGRNGDDPF